MKSKSIKFLLLLEVVILVAFSGCGQRGRPTRSTSELDSILVEEPIQGDPLYVTGVENTISLKESDEDNGKVLDRLKIGEEVEFISDDSQTCFYVSYGDDDIRGYIKKEYLTKEKLAVCKRQDAYILRETALNDLNEGSITEIEKLGKNSKIFIVSKNSGDYWFVYSKSSKIFGYVKNMDISDEPVVESKPDSNSSQLNNNNNLLIDYPVGYGHAPLIPYDIYYVTNVNKYLAIRSARTYDGYNELGKMYEGDKVYVLDKSTGKYWYCYSPTNKIYGYVDSTYLGKKPKTTDTDTDKNKLYVGHGEPPISDYSTYYVSGVNKYLAIRSEKINNENNELGKMYEGDKVYVLDKSTGKYWYCYSPTNEVYGYTNSEYLSSKKPDSDSSVSSDIDSEVSSYIDSDIVSDTSSDIDSNTVSDIFYDTDTSEMLDSSYDVSSVTDSSSYLDIMSQPDYYE